MTVRAREWEMVELPCAAQGHPVPDYTWVTWEIQLNSVIDSTACGILNVRWDSGIYACLVNNSVGTQIVRTNLIISAPLTAFVEPQTQTVNAGNEAVLKCTVTGYPINSIVWVHNGNMAKTHLMMITFLVSDAVPVIIEGFESRVLQSGPSLTLVCIFSGNPRPWITWYIDDMEIKERRNKYAINDRVIDSGLVEARLNVSNIRTENGGLYSCRGSNGRGVTSHSAMINVFGLPGVRTMKNVSTVAGSTLSFRCQTTGYPIKSISWLRDGTLLRKSNRHKISNNGTLLIKEASPNIDNGQYTCIARNKQNKAAQGSLWVTVKVRPKVEEMASKIAEEGQTVTLMCSVSVGDRPISKHWVKDGNPIPQDLGITITEANVFSALVINSIQQIHSGNYTCIATNQVGSDNKSASIRVKDLTKMICAFYNVHLLYLNLYISCSLAALRPLNKTVQEMSSVFFHCSGSGYPTPVAKWFRHLGLEKIKENERFKLFTNGTLSISKVTNSDKGEYMCKMGNGMSSEKSTAVFLKVGAPPNVTFASRNIISAVYKTVSMDCQIVGSSPISVKWRRNNRIINLIKDARVKTRRFPFPRGVKSQLRISNVKNTDQGTYSCIANNKFGKHSDSLVLSIITVPHPPQALQIESHINGSMTVFWKYDASLGLPNIEFILQIKRESGGFFSTAITYQTLISAEKFTMNDKYSLRLIARNRIGYGKPSNEIMFTATEAGMHKNSSNNKSTDFDNRSLSELDQYGKLISMSTITPGGDNDKQYEPIRNSYSADIYFDDVSPYATFQVTNPSQGDGSSPKKPKELSTFQQGSYSHHQDGLSQIY
ncbi:Down syndrome cell adhesion molecule [Nymphon striatum]|nr:Down syndrome cell adhesion molecule [Nymphon striatum]